MGVLELTALPSIGKDRRTSWARDADVLLVDGSDATYRAHWMRTSGLPELLPSLTDTVWVGVSANRMVLTPRIGSEFVARPDAPDDRTLGLVDFFLFPHLDVFSTNTMADAEHWATAIGGPAYVIDDQTAVTVDGHAVEVMSKGRWRRLPH
ncbi:Type 1 glutamine amidotransferase-like domain-containing protein [Phycicoccus mangrovi]|uniref:Type 1 glutamine amidotransferase-like domain-containing protein n=1 Tax=Phycicoccus mangrovi TaxID=2840470 RepID=UPI0027E2E64D|nr:Type 1 glutamine amidotransferase-like domain-containing protein [Phycicoccus mangrovi]